VAVELMIFMNDERMISFGYCAIKSSVIDLEIIDSTELCKWRDRAQRRVTGLVGVVNAIEEQT
jgi:hypothetical protein